ncbi:MAG: ribosome biogenesis/translation initiation ATPase RLI [Desulfurococcaceae archaeon]
MVRIAVIDRDYCKPDKCNLECMKFCPINRGKKVKAVDLSSDRSHAIIFENVCMGCGICIKKCPFNAISIVNVPDEYEKLLIHRYGENMFKLYNLPAPRRGSILGIIGKNGAGKTTSIRILSGQLRPNLGKYDDPPGWDEIIRAFRGTELQTYLIKLSNNEIKAIVKPQYVELTRRVLKGTVIEILRKIDERGLMNDIVQSLGLKNILERKISELSGGELQKFLITATLVKNANAYFFDEPCSYLDIRERLRIANVIREFSDYEKNYVIVVEHDLMVLDYISDHISVVYGEPGVFGIVSKPYSARSGINHYLKGYLPAENMRIREEELKFNITIREKEKSGKQGFPVLKWERLEFQYPSSDFKLVAEPGEILSSEVIGILGPNGIGKTTFIKLLSNELKPKEGAVLISTDKVSIKPQEISPRFFTEETVIGNLKKASPDTVNPSTWLYNELIRKLRLDKMFDRKIGDLSGGELQKLAIAYTLSQDADIYLLDEPSAYLDVEERISISKIIRRIIEDRQKASIVVEHDLMVQNYISDKLIVFTGTPAIMGYASTPLDLRKGLNILLKQLNITVRRDPETGRPRINKLDSVADREQKLREEYYLAD